MKTKVLLVSEKYCDANPDLGLTNSFHNLLHTFISTQANYHINTLHLDESKILYQKPIDEVLLNYCKQYEVHIIIITLLGDSSFNPSFNCLTELKKMGIYLCFIWPDTGPGWGLQTIKELGDIANLHVSIDNPVYIPEKAYNNNHLILWTPEDESLYYLQPNKQKDIEVSFVGSPRYSDRAYFLNYLMGHYPSVIIRGGQREEKLPPEKYAQLIRRSKISINFSLSPSGFFQTKGRVFEIISTGGLLMEFKNPATAKLFTPNEDYIEFEKGEDLVEKIKYYLPHEDERLKICAQGYYKYINNYTSWHFWDKVMKYIEADLKV